MSIQDIAQQFADRLAVRVFPIRIDEDGKKHPLVAAWQRAASRDASKFPDELWARADGYGVMPDGYTVIDFDTAAGATAFADAIGGGQVETMFVDTPRGVHVWFRGVTRHVNGLLEGVDIRSGPDKGYIIGPGSCDPIRGREWRVRGDDWNVAEIPAKVAALIMGEAAERPVRDARPEWDTLLAEGRNVALTSLKGTLMGQGVPEETANAAVRAMNATLPEPLPASELESTVLSHKESWEVGTLSLPRTIFDLRLYTVEDIMRLQPPSYIIEPIFPEGTVNVMFGAPGTYKSFIALDLAARISTGTTLPGANGKAVGTVPRPRRVLYIAAEGKSGLGKRFRASRALEESNLFVYPDALNLRDADDLKLVGDLIYEHQFEVVFFDTLRKMTPGADENDVRDMGQLMTNLEKLSNALNCTMVLVHHSNRTERGDYRGSSAIEGDAYNMWKIVSEAPLTARIESFKFKDAEPVTFDVTMGVNTTHNSLYVAHYRDATETLPLNVGVDAEVERVLSTDEWMTVQEVHQALGDRAPSESTVRRRLDDATESGRVERRDAMRLSGRGTQAAAYRLAT